MVEKCVGLLMNTQAQCDVSHRSCPWKQQMTERFHLTVQLVAHEGILKVNGLY